MYVADQAFTARLRIYFRYYKWFLTARNIEKPQGDETQL